MDLKIPDHWQQIPHHKTRTQLLSQRRKKLLPDISFDLDGDGVVGGTDYVIAKKFDLDQDGKLNQEQRSAALKALSQGYDNNLIWGCDSSGITRSFRVVQKRGLGILDEDFTQIRKTYPYSPKGSQTVKTKKDISQRLHQEVLEASKGFQKKLEFDFTMDLPAERLIHTELYRNKPKYRSISQKREANTQMARQKIGLAKTNFLTREGQIGLGYQQNPLIKTAAQLSKLKKERHLQQLNDSVDFSHKVDYQRLMEREKLNEQPRNNGITYKEIKEKIKKEDFTHYQQTFTNRPQGVHGRQLPQFSKYKKLYWDQNTPKEQSQRSLLQKRKLTQVLYRGKPQMMVLNDNDLHPPDEFVKKYKEYQRLVVQETPISEPPQRICHRIKVSEEFSPRKTDFSTNMLKFLSMRRSSLGEVVVRKKRKVQENLEEDKRVVINSSKYISTSMANQLVMKGQLNYTHKRLRSGGF